MLIPPLIMMSYYIDVDDYEKMYINMSHEVGMFLALVGTDEGLFKYLC